MYSIHDIPPVAVVFITCLITLNVGCILGLHLQRDTNFDYWKSLTVNTQDVFTDQVLNSNLSSPTNILETNESSTKRDKIHLDPLMNVSGYYTLHRARRSIEDFYDDPDNRALYLVLPLIVIIYGGCSVTFCLYKLRKYWKRKNKRQRKAKERALREKLNENSEAKGDDVSKSLPNISGSVSQLHDTLNRSKTSMAVFNVFHTVRRNHSSKNLNETSLQVDDIDEINEINNAESIQLKIIPTGNNLEKEKDDFSTTPKGTETPEGIGEIANAVENTRKEPLLNSESKPSLIKTAMETKTTTKSQKRAAPNIHKNQKEITKGNKEGKTQNGKLANISITKQPEQIKKSNKFIKNDSENKKPNEGDNKTKIADRKPEDMKQKEVLGQNIKENVSEKADVNRNTEVNVEKPIDGMETFIDTRSDKSLSRSTSISVTLKLEKANKLSVAELQELVNYYGNKKHMPDVLIEDAENAIPIIKRSRRKKEKKIYVD